jgi:hypothetical protein
MWYHPLLHECPPTGGSHGKPHQTTKILSRARRRGGRVAAGGARAVACGQLECFRLVGHRRSLYGVEYVDYPLGQRIVRLRPARSKEASLAGEQSACRSQIKLMYGSHHQQPQKECRYDELDPYLVVREPSMHMIEPIHGQPPSGYHAPPSPIHYHIHGR